MSRRGKCILNDRLRDRYPFLETTSSKSDIKCKKCNSNFSIASGGNSDIVRHINSAKHKATMKNASTTQSTSHFKPDSDYTMSSVADGMPFCENGELHSLEMDHFEGIFVPEPTISQHPTDMARLKLGEVFNNSKNEYEIVCIHCSREFNNFNHFAMHAQEHLSRRFEECFVVKEECQISESQRENRNVANDEFVNPRFSVKSDDAAAAVDHIVDNDAENNTETEDDRTVFNPIKSDPDDLANMNGLINSYFKTDRTVRNHMNPDEYRPLVAGVDYDLRDGMYVCLRCNRSLTKSSSLRDHLASHRNKKYYKCPHCDKSFTALPNTQKHISRVHKKVYSRQIIREAQTVKKADFHAFLMQSMEQKKIKKKFECYKCKKALSDIHKLRQHLVNHDKRESKPKREEIEHDGKTYRKCLTCNKYYTLNYYREHLLTHKGDKRFLCSLCGAAFLVAPQLRRHMIIHERKRRYKCDVCPSTYTRSQALIEHRRMHSEPLPFTCDICGKGYLTFRTLHSHKGKHKSKELN